ncbi:hypothetical protein BDN72DRAFT_883968 [Pluteus cervinus]|uniref:Uncharacterized protein n=1 Tax=Pluteus cervinus TaxID=181527 RepID=A0ACD3A1L2_9AGAR|nr:hypothetical protein BDN72DRAFT_883968 [Pluteus cervinus]
MADQTALSIPVFVVDILTHFLNSDAGKSDLTLVMDIDKDILDHFTLSGPLVQKIHQTQQFIDMLLATEPAMSELFPVVKTVSSLLSRLQSIQSISDSFHEVYVAAVAVFHELVQVIDLILTYFATKGKVLKYLVKENHTITQALSKLGSTVKILQEAIQFDISRSKN